MTAVGILECTTSPSFGELVFADTLGLALWGAGCALVIGLVYTYRGRLRRWLD